MVSPPPQEAWHVVTTVDAFFDSDEEDMDESARHAYGTSFCVGTQPVSHFCRFQPCVSRYLLISIRALPPPLVPVSGNKQVPPDIVSSRSAFVTVTL